MKLVPWRTSNVWNSANEVESLQDNINQLFNFSFGRVDTDGETRRTWIPAVDVTDNKNQIRIKAELPGLNREDIRVSIDNDVLSITGEKKREEKKEEDTVIRTERVYGTFYRAITLPKTVDTNSVQAQYKNGVLELTLLKKEEAKPKQIDIKVD